MPSGAPAGTALRALLLDMDGTLLDSEKLWDIALHDLAGHLGGVMRPDTRAALVGSSGVNAMRIVFDAMALPRDPAAMAEAGYWLHERITALFVAGVPLCDGAADLLAHLRTAGPAVALVTNTRRELAMHGINTLGADNFVATVCGDEVAHGKPAPDPYLRAAALLGLEPGQCLAIEDSPTGTASAVAAGCAVLVVPNDIAVPVGPGRVFRDSLVGLRIGELHEIYATSLAGHGADANRFAACRTDLEQ